MQGVQPRAVLNLESSVAAPSFGRWCHQAYLDRDRPLIRSIFVTIRSALAGQARRADDAESAVAAKSSCDFHGILRL